jgi:hypothetical protein
MRKLATWMFVTILTCGAAMVLTSCKSKATQSQAESKDAGAPDYSQKSCWYQIPEASPSQRRASTTATMCSTTTTSRLT